MFSIEDRAKPVLKWAGGKSALLAQIIPLCPTSFRRYVEPFLGGGALFLALDKRVPAILNDANPELIALYEVIQKNPRALEKVLSGYRRRYSEKFFYSLRESQPKSLISQVARTVFLNKTGYNGLYRQNSRGIFNVPFGKRPRCPGLIDKENLLAVSDRLQKAKLVRSDFEKILSKTGKGDFVYCDPPYDPLSTTSSFHSYVANGFGRDEQVRLRDACRKAVARGAIVAVSNSATNFIREIYKDSEIHILKARRAINSKGSHRGFIDELFILV